MVVIGALLIIVAHLLNSWGLLQKKEIEPKSDIPQSIVDHRQEEVKRNRKVYWRPNVAVAHITRDLAEATHHATRRFSIA